MSLFAYFFKTVSFSVDFPLEHKFELKAIK